MAETTVIEAIKGCFVVRGLFEDPEAVVTSMIELGEQTLTDGMLVFAGVAERVQVRREFLPGPPPLEDGVEDCVEVSVRAATAVTVSEFMADTDEDDLSFIPRPGSYRIRVSAWGRDSSSPMWLSAGSIGNARFLLQAWPAPTTPAEVVRHGPDPDAPADVSLPEVPPGFSASQRIARDLNQAPGSRVLSGQRGQVSVERALPGTRRRLFPYVANVQTWSHLVPGDGSWAIGESGGKEYTPEVKMYARSRWPDGDNLAGGPGCQIKSWFTEVSRPAWAVRRWDWEAYEPGTSVRDGLLVRHVATELRIELNESVRGNGEKWTSVRFTHVDLPVEWVDDMNDWWTMQLALAHLRRFDQF